MIGGNLDGMILYLRTTRYVNSAAAAVKGWSRLGFKFRDKACFRLRIYPIKDKQTVPATVTEF